MTHPKKTGTEKKMTSTEFYAEVGGNIKNARHLRAMTQARLAKTLRTHRSTIAQIELGIRRPHLHELQLLNDALGLTIEQLLQGTRTPIK